MPEKRVEPTPPTQKTPKGLEIPVPTREDWDRNMGKVAPPPEPAKPDESDDRD